MKLSCKLFSLSVVALTAGALAAGWASAADQTKQKSKEPDDAIRWEAPAAAPAEDSNSAPAAAAPASPQAGYRSLDDDLQNIWDEMDRLHRSMASRMGGGWGWSGGLMHPVSFSSVDLSGADMHSDVLEKDDEYVITCELPGVPKEDIQINVDGSSLVVRATRNAGTDRSGDENGQKYHYRERSYGTTERRFQVGSGVDPKKIKAQLKDGVLTLHVPKGENRSASVPIEG